MKKSSKILMVFLFVHMMSELQAQKIESIPLDQMKKKIVKFDLFSPLTGNTTLGYETYLKNFTSLEFKVGLIGVGYQDHVNGGRENGAFVSVGPKFKLKPSHAVDGMYSTHVLRGGYFRPEFSIGSFNIDRDDLFYSSEKENATFVTVVVNFGQQYIIGESFAMDWFFGLGYAYANEHELSYYYKSIIGASHVPLALNAGFTMGVLLK